ncbi:MAG: hypothetical protein ACUVWO_03695 [Thermodesulfobacteriota bacterium]
MASSQRMDSKVLGVPVNLAKRLEEATKILHVDMIISDQVFKHLPDRSHHRLRYLGKARVKRALSPMTLFEVYDQDPPEVRNLKDRIGCILTEGTGLVRAGHLEPALAKFQEAQSISPQDLPIHLLVTSLKNLLEQNHTITGRALLDLR